MNSAFRYTFAFIPACLVAASGLASFCSAQEVKAGWKKHLITQPGHCNTAVALDANGDKALDVIASFKGRVSLFLAPDWREIVIHRFVGKGGGEGAAAIHSEVIDADGDGDMDLSLIHI
jgi:hypothetical protein